VKFRGLKVEYDNHDKEKRGEQWNESIG
jgi:hypothetical protein